METGEGFLMRWRGIGLIAGLVIDAIAADSSWRPLSIFVFAGAGLVLGELIERLWLGTAKWSLSLFSFSILAILGPLAFTWAYYEWQDWRRNSATYPLPEPLSVSETLDSD